MASDDDAGLEAIFRTGHEVGQLATKRYPGGILVEENYLHQAEAREATQKALRTEVPAIFEAAFIHERVKVRIDVLRRAARGWDIIEAKSTLSAKAVHVHDLAVQTWVARGAGVHVRHAGVLTLNRDYVYQGGAHDANRLFVLHDKTEEVEDLLGQIDANVQVLHAMLRQPEAPAVRPGTHCFKPYDCPFYGHCTRDVAQPDHPLSELRLSAADEQQLVASGVTEVAHIPGDLELSEQKEGWRRAITTGVPWVNRKGLHEALASVTYPVHHFDFETFGAALPRIVGTSPYGVVPFQWSNHIQEEDGSVRHEEFLWRERSDPRPACIEAFLRSLGTSGSICVYSSYEAQCFRRLMREFPEYEKDIAALLPRLWDLLPIVRAHVYHPDFRGSFSIKSVLPALVPSLSYERMEIADGGTASFAYLDAFNSQDDAQRSRTFGALQKYCEKDTLAMLELRRALTALAPAQGVNPMKKENRQDDDE